MHRCSFALAHHSLDAHHSVQRSLPQQNDVVSRIHAFSLPPSESFEREGNFWMWRLIVRWLILVLWINSTITVARKVRFILNIAHHILRLYPTQKIWLLLCSYLTFDKLPYRILGMILLKVKNFNFNYPAQNT